ncbi:MAG: winged helix-turn-helix transcriptional regulator [Spirochaetaceae bacterium]|nr:winged helix-turn-helix transcriptional regulator [Spirochaetaceae bacterium]MBO7485086.1 winged helix-turn-helix transcriptional regulator [Spirochaetaceae bacterium]MBP5328824.1 winged helix-turn-helix transcriptional regulator [Spirochaetaceae bacterium]
MKSNYSDILSIISKIHSDAASFLKIQLKNKGYPELVSSHGNILFQLSQNHQMTMTQIAAAVHRDKSTTTVLVNKLIKEGYVESYNSEKDSRIKKIKLSAKGEELSSNMKKISKSLQDCYYRNFSEEEIKQLYTLLKKLSDSFDSCPADSDVFKTL